MTAKAPHAVSLSKVAEELDTWTSEWRSYLNRRTGEILQFEQSVLSAVEDGDDDMLEDWQREELAQAGEILDSQDWVELPRDDIDDWRIMRGYCDSLDSDDTRAELLTAIHGRGAFRMFKATVRRLELEQAWYSFRGSQLRRIARDWLEANGIEFQE